MQRSSAPASRRPAASNTSSYLNTELVNRPPFQRVPSMLLTRTTSGLPATSSPPVYRTNIKVPHFRKSVALKILFRSCWQPSSPRGSHIASTSLYQVIYTRAACRSGRLRFSVRLDESPSLALLSARMQKLQRRIAHGCSSLKPELQVNRSQE
jgi:hypothetical protein